MPHLSPGQLVDVVEGSAPADHVAHAGSCDACRTRADALRDALRQAASDEVPEPSPLFWEHMAARVGAAVRREPVSGESWASWTGRWAPMTAVAMLVLVVGLGTSMWNWSPRAVPVTPGPAALTAGVAAPEADEDLASQDDPSWTLMTVLSADVVYDDETSSELPSAPGLVDRALQQLTEPERAELAKILREEMARPSAADSKRAGD